MIFPELKNIEIFSKLNPTQIETLKNTDFIFLLSLLIVDETDNSEYFLYKYNISNKDQKRIKILVNFYREKIDKKKFTENNLNKILYYHGRESVIDILNFGIIKFQRFDKKLIELISLYRDKMTPTMPVGAKLLMTKYEIPEGKHLGLKLKMIEEEWIKNDFQISDNQIDNIINN